MRIKRQHTERAMKVAFWRPHITGFHTSNMNAKAYCQKHRLVLHQLKYRQYEIEKEAGAELSALPLNANIATLIPYNWKPDIILD